MSSSTIIMAQVVLLIGPTVSPSRDVSGTTTLSLLPPPSLATRGRLRTGLGETNRRRMLFCVLVLLEAAVVVVEVVRREGDFDTDRRRRGAGDGEGEDLRDLGFATPPPSAAAAVFNIFMYLRSCSLREARVMGPAS